MRASRLAAHGYLTVVEEAGLGGASLAKGIAQALESSGGPAQRPFRMDGAEQTANYLREFLSREDNARELSP